MNRAVVVLVCIHVATVVGQVEPTAEPNAIGCGERMYPRYPGTVAMLPELPSPLPYLDGSEWLVVRVESGRYSVVPVTVENGLPLNYKKGQWGKGRQRAVDEIDFPALAQTGLHSDEQLAQTQTITGRSVAEITRRGRPEALSGAGFLARDEDIISVLRGDNRLVQKMGLTHRQLARHLFYLWNLVVETKGNERRFTVLSVLYDDKWIEFRAEGTKGWQESIFDDEILGTYQFDVARALEPEEKAFLAEKYANLTPEQMGELIEKLTRLHTGEMVPYYVMRYGFYEGHTSYRADPIALARIFGLKSLQQIEAAFPGRLYEVLTARFTPEFVAHL